MIFNSHKIMLCRIYKFFYKINVKQSTVINSVCQNYFHSTPYLLGKTEDAENEKKKKGESLRKCLFIPIQKGKKKKTRKVSIIGGAGRAGLGVAHNLIISNYCDEMVLVDLPEKKDQLYGNYIDLAHCNPARQCPKIKMCTTQEKSKNSDLLIITAGKPRKANQTRLDLVKTNAELFKAIIPSLAKHSPNSVILVVANPTDILAWLAWKFSGFPKNRIISTGTELDSARFRYHISKRLGINAASVHGWVVGEHGGSSVPVWSSVHVAGTALREIDPAIGTAEDTNNWIDIHKQVVADGGTVIGLKGKTEWAISFATENIAKSVLNNSHTVHAVSTQITGMYGVQTDCFLSFPCVIGNRGVHKIININLDNEEQENLRKSAVLLEKVAKGLNM